VLGISTSYSIFMAFYFFNKNIVYTFACKTKSIFI